jgi:hypothetical protein
MGSRIGRIGVVLATLLVFIPSGTVAPLAAPVASVSDPEDVRGRLDITEVTVQRRLDGGVAFTVRFAEAFKDGVLRPDRNFVAVFINTDGDADIELSGGSRGYYGEIHPERVYLSFATRNEAGYDLGDRFLSRPDGHSVRWALPDYIIGADPFTVVVESAWMEGGGICDPTCIDIAPDLGSSISVP